MEQHVNMINRNAYMLVSEAVMSSSFGVPLSHSIWKQHFGRKRFQLTIKQSILSFDSFPMASISLSRNKNHSKRRHRTMESEAWKQTHCGGRWLFNRGYHVITKVALDVGINKLVLWVFRDLTVLSILAPISYICDKKMRPPLNRLFLASFYFLELTSPLEFSFFFHFLFVGEEISYQEFRWDVSNI